jgi:UPF0271 protein
MNKRPVMRLNCDLGEGEGKGEGKGESRAGHSGGSDQAVMPHIHQANIACGFHAGDPVVMRNTVALAKTHGVAIGAHPSYNDPEHFGRRSIDLTAPQITALLHEQIAALERIATGEGMALQHVKPHGALYNDMMTKPQTRKAIMDAMASYRRPLPLVLLATADAQQHRMEAQQAGIELLFEAFADRAYTDQGRLLSRSEPGAVLDLEAMLAQVEQLCAQGSVTTHTGNTLAIAADTLCVHGDNPQGVAAISAIRALVDNR